MTTDATGATGTAPKGEVPWGPLIDGIATANKRMLTQAEEIQRLQVYVLFATVMFTTVYIVRGNHGVC